MKIAIMQPYIFPYLGYFQLVNVVDTFVFFDDVNFIKKGWINRNQILLESKLYKFTIPLQKASQNKLINEIYIADYNLWKKNFVKKLEICYNKAPYFEQTIKLILDILYIKNYNLISELSSMSIQLVSSCLGLNTSFLYSSNLNYKRKNTNGQGKIISICKELQATDYINPINGVDMYDKNKFKDNNLGLNFIKMDGVKYQQFNRCSFKENLSIIDVLMFNSVNSTKSFIQNSFQLI